MIFFIETNTNCIADSLTMQEDSLLFK